MLEAGDLGAAVPGCGDWTLRDLPNHRGDIHRWARAQVLGAPDGGHRAPARRAELVGWFREGADDLRATLDAVDPDTPCATLADPPAARFWMRRQAHETSLHRGDAECSQGGPAGPDAAPFDATPFDATAFDDTAFDAELALDGVDEVLTTTLPRQLCLGRMPPPARPVRFSVPDGATWLIGDPRVEDRPGVSVERGRRSSVRRSR